MRGRRQYTGSAGKITNCQIGVFATYASCHVHAFIDRELYLPKAWTDDPVRMAASHVPEGTAFATKPARALAMIRGAIGAAEPFSWVAADTVYGVGDIEMALRHTGRGYVLGASASRAFHAWGKPHGFAGTVQQIAEALPADVCRRPFSGEGTKGERMHDWAYLDLADFNIDEYN